ncbi:MAG: GTPase Era [Vicinamibacterales bacterium]|jgi:GTP-binding protein Era|nr:GTPase Era [Vicinamibacterales bacterium]
MRSGFVSLIGRPNAGKSTLLNRIVGTKLAIVSDKPQTTRNRIMAVRNYDGDPAAQVVFVDTPGIHRPLHRMNVRMVDMAYESIGDVDVIGLVRDATDGVGAGDRFVLEKLTRATRPVLLVLNKIDLISKTRLLPLMDWYSQQRDFAAIVPVSARNGDGVDLFERAIIEQLPDGEALYPEDYLTDQPERVLAAETVREKVLQHTRAELPFTTAVVVDQFDEVSEPGRLLIYCSILVERQSQKPIVIGPGGALVKQIGTEARRDLEAFFGSRVYLDLHVKVRADWRENDRILDQAGVAPPTKSRR